MITSLFRKQYYQLTIDVQPGRMGRLSSSVFGYARILSSVFDHDVANVHVRYHIPVHRNVLTNHESGIKIKTKVFLNITRTYVNLSNSNNQETHKTNKSSFNFITKTKLKIRSQVLLPSLLFDPKISFDRKAHRSTLNLDPLAVRGRRNKYKNFPIRSESTW